jgi:hypothetical protein
MSSASSSAKRPVPTWAIKRRSKGVIERRRNLASPRFGSSEDQAGAEVRRQDQSEQDHNRDEAGKEASAEAQEVQRVHGISLEIASAVSASVSVGSSGLGKAPTRHTLS